MTDPSPEPPSPAASATAAAAATTAHAAVALADHPPELAGPHHDDEAPEQPPAPFAPIYSLVTNQSTRTTHHPHVHYIFSDDDPDLLSQALAQQQEANALESATETAPASRAVLLDLAADLDGGYRVAAASSLSPAWAVLDAQLSRISPPASDGGSASASASGHVRESPRKPDRLMLRIEGIEADDGGAAGSEGELRLSDRSAGAGASGSGSVQRDHKGEGEDYAQLVDEFEKRMSMLRKVVEASEERRRNVALDAPAQSVSIQVTEEPADPPAPV